MPEPGGTDPGTALRAAPGWAAPDWAAPGWATEPSAGHGGRTQAKRH